MIYPATERGTCHGISAAFGKLGAIVGTQIFLYLKDTFCYHDTDECTHEQTYNGLRLTFGVCSALGVIGFIWSYYLVYDNMNDYNKVNDINENNNHIDNNDIELNNNKNKNNQNDS